MPQYKLPPMKKMDVPKEMAEDSMPYPDEYARSVTIPVNDEILEMMKVGDAVDVTLMGKVTETRNDDSMDYPQKSITIEISSVDAYPEGYMEDMEHGSHESYSRGFNKGMGGSHKGSRY